jgi:hypothetical protein
MLIDFQPVPEFVEGQPIAAYDLNTFNLNNAYIYKLLAQPQPLFMDSHAYAPKAFPLNWYSPEFVIWKGSFLYREGMNKAYLGFHVKMDGMLTDMGNGDASEYLMSDFGTTDVDDNVVDGVSIGVIVKYTELSYLNIFKTKDNPSSEIANKYWRYWTSAPLNKAQTVTSKDDTFTFTIKDGSGRNQTMVNDHLAPNARVSTLTIDLTNLDFQDGEIVPISLLLLVNQNPYKSEVGNVNFQNKYRNFNNYYLLKSPGALTGSEVTLGHIFYSHLYARTDGDFSYTDNWDSVKNVTTTGNSVLSTTNLRKLSGKQRYITDRLRYRPMPLTGSLFYISVYGGTSSVKYSQYDVVPGEWEYSLEQFAVPVSSDGEFWPADLKFRGRLIDYAAIYNPQSNLATFAWDPYFDKYNELLISFKYYGNTEARQFLMVDIPESPVSLTSIRNNVITLGTGDLAKQQRSGHIYGYADGGDGLSRLWYGYYGSVYLPHSTHAYINNSNSIKAYANHMYQVRIPSTTTKVYSPEKNAYNPGDEFYFRSGLYQDDVSILFEEKSPSSDLWGLKKDSDVTIQYGFVGNNLVNNLKPLYKARPNIANEFETKQYTRLTNYNNDDWAWKIDDNRTKGFSQVFVNLYDHHSPSLKNKANYIGYCHLIGASDFNSAGSMYDKPADYSMNQQLTYSSLVSGITEINDRLDLHYNALFVSNPHFKYYDMFWESPKSPLILRNIYKDYTDKFFYFTKQRSGNVLIVRGKNVTLYYGEVKDIKREGKPFGSLHKLDDVGVEFENSESVISGDNEQTVIFHFTKIPNLSYNERYYLQGEDIVFAAEFFEEPS